MQVLDHEQNRRLREASLEERAHGEVDLALKLLGLDPPRPGIGFAEPKDMIEGRRELGALGRGQA